MTFADELKLIRDRVYRRLMRHRERYIRAWIAATGLRPEDSMLEERMVGGGLFGGGFQTVVVRRRDEACLRCGFRDPR